MPGSNSTGRELLSRDNGAGWHWRFWRKIPSPEHVPDEDARLDTNDSFLSCVVHAAHFYTDYVYVPGVATYNEVPSTPTFSRVRFNAPATNDQEMRRKYIRRMKIVPVRLVFWIWIPNVQCILVHDIMCDVLYIEIEHIISRKQRIQYMF